MVTIGSISSGLFEGNIDFVCNFLHERIRRYGVPRPKGLT